MDLINWTMAHKLEIIALVGGIVTVASVVVKMTPTPKDDAALAVVVKVLNALALNPKK